MKHRFIVIEALDAGGSQTQTDELTKKLRRVGYSVKQLHFPQEDRATGRFVYDLFLLSQNKPKFSRREQALIYIQDFYSRQEDIHNHLKKGNGSVVVSDRFYTSTLAYQSIGLAGKKRKEMIDWMKLLTEEGKLRLPKPDLVIFLDTPVEISLQHLKNKKKDHFENKEKLTAIRNSYLRVAKEGKWAVIDGVDGAGKQRSIKDIHEEIWRKVN